MFADLLRLEKKLVRPSGFEPPRYCYRQPLKLVRLPVPPRPHVVDRDSLTASEIPCKPTQAMPTGQFPATPLMRALKCNYEESGVG